MIKKILKSVFGTNWLVIYILAVSMFVYMAVVSFMHKYYGLGVTNAIITFLIVVVFLAMCELEKSEILIKDKDIRIEFRDKLIEALSRDNEDMKNIIETKDVTGGQR